MRMDSVVLPMPYLARLKHTTEKVRNPILSVLLMFQERGREPTTSTTCKATAVMAAKTRRNHRKGRQRAKTGNLSNIRPRTGAAPRGQKGEKIKGLKKW